MSPFELNFALAALSLLLLLLLHRRWNPYAYWRRLNVPHLPPAGPLGVLGRIAGKERSFGAIIHDIHKGAGAERVLGMHFAFRPVLLVRDLALVRRILTADFGSFYDRGTDFDRGKDLFSLRGQQWKAMRAKLMPSFSTGKLKGMFRAVDDVGIRLVAHVRRQLQQTPTKRLDIKYLMTTYAVDVVGTVIFGLDIDSFANASNEFHRVIASLFQRPGILNNLNFAATFIFPWLSQLLAKLGYQDAAIAAIKEIAKRTMRHREQHQIVRQDMLQLLLELRNTGRIAEDKAAEEEEEAGAVWNMKSFAGENSSKMDEDLIASQAFLFYIAGTETTATNAAHTLYELSMYPDLLRRAQAEVRACLSKHGLAPADQLTYEALQDTPFLDLCIMETLRKYPGLPFLNRECTKDYPVPGMELTIERGTPIVISLLGLHYDPEFFPSPLDYQPDRYSEKGRNYNPLAYMPFGEGPKHCIALRMGKINSKVAIMKFLANFDIQPQARKELEFVYDPTPAYITKEPFYLTVSERADVASSA